jgi:hypothetical protein
MVQVYLAAEADKIQDLIFRSSHLREVVGGSQLLARFCHEANAMVPKHGNVIVNDGGSFRILFETDDVSSEELSRQAFAFGEQLAEEYRKELGGSLSVAKPVLVDKGFKQAVADAEQFLREAKRNSKTKMTAFQFPYAALCASCGVELAVCHQKLDPNDRREQYLCKSCLRKAEERAMSGTDRFITPFIEQIVGAGKKDQYNWPHKAEEVAGNYPFDARGYVAYLLADGNNMGEIFGQCTNNDALRQLSENLTIKMRESIAEPTRFLMERIKNSRVNFVPVLPLIMAGDDLFALLPATWSLDFARCLAEAYENKMGLVIDQINLEFPELKLLKPSLAVAVVICKAKYPYYLAHQYGEDLLAEAKQMGKRYGYKMRTIPKSTIAFDLIQGANLAREPDGGGYFRSTLRPYFLTGDVDEWGIGMDELVAQRGKLMYLPHRRLSQVRDFFDDLPQKPGDLKIWMDRFEKLLKRIAFNPTDSMAVEAALAALGGKEFFKVSREDSATDYWRGHAMPDLVDVWDFALDLNIDREVYEV